MINKNNIQIQGIIHFLNYLKWRQVRQDYQTINFQKQNFYKISLNQNKIYFTREKENIPFLTIPLNYYALIGALLYYSQASLETINKFIGV